MLGGGLAMLARGVFVRHERAAWLLLGAAMLLSDGIGDLVYTNAYSNPDNIPFPGPADALYLSFFPLAYVGIVLLVRSRIGALGASLWLDAAVTGLATAAVASALVFQTVVDSSQGYSTSAFATNLAYPIGDFAMLALVVGALAAIGWRFYRTWSCVFGARHLRGRRQHLPVPGRQGDVRGRDDPGRRLPVGRRPTGVRRLAAVPSGRTAHRGVGDGRAAAGVPLSPASACSSTTTTGA